MTDLDTLLRAVIAEPDEDTPRLAYADAAQESGDEARAEFIRVQCELARLGQVDRTCPFIKEYSRPKPGPMPVERWKEGNCQCRGCQLVRREQELWRAKIHTPLVQIENPNYCAWLCCGTRKEDHPNVWLQTWRRGFCEEIRYDAANFLEMADHLIWHPEQTVECPKCKGEGEGNWWNGVGLGKYDITACSRCNGTGRVPRPCPPTAQPIRKVVLTTRPALDDIGGTPFLGWLEYAYTRWPGVEFELPDFTNWEQGDDPDPTIRRDLRNMAEQIRRETTGRIT